ncbi:hypothetical protein ACFL6P_03240 [Candidatus Latescibacterota bacterium]
MAYVEVNSDVENPDENWYKKTSMEFSLEPICPHIGINSCPKYFYCLSNKMGKIFQNISSKFPKRLKSESDIYLMNYWKNQTTLWTLLEENFPTIETKNQIVIKNYCPEVSFKLFELYGSDFQGFGPPQVIDEDVDDEGNKYPITIPSKYEISRFEKCREEKIPSGHWLWKWSSVKPEHYSNCPFNSKLPKFSFVKVDIEKGVPDVTPEKFLIKNNTTDNNEEGILKPIMDTSESTSLNYWTTNNGDIFKISTYSNDKLNGDASFKLYHGKISKQRILMKLLLENRSATIGEIINYCYTIEKNGLKSGSKQDAIKLLANVRSLVSDIRKKLSKNNICREIINPLRHNVDIDDKVFLKVKTVNNLDDKHFKSKNILSYKSPDEINVGEIHPDYTHNNNLLDDELE